MTFQALTQTMAALTDIHESLLELAEQKKQVLIRNDVEQLIQIITKENKLVRQIGELDQQRVEVIGQLMVEKGYKPNPKVTVSDLTKIIFNIEDKKALLGLQKQLLAAIRKLKEVNQLNQQLIMQSLDYINYSLDLVTGAPQNETVYQHPQQNSYGIKRSGVFDTRA